MDEYVLIRVKNQTCIRYMSISMYMSVIYGHIMYSRVIMDNGSLLINDVILQITDVDKVGELIEILSVINTMR